VEYIISTHQHPFFRNEQLKKVFAKLPNVCSRIAKFAWFSSY